MGRLGDVANATIGFFRKSFWCKFGTKLEDWEPVPRVSEELCDYEIQLLRQRSERK